jgi:hypothetical protein
MTDTGSHHFAAAVLEILDETFGTHHGYYLDKGDSLFLTLSGISATEASRPVSATCASIAAQVHHTTYYLDVLRQDLDPTHHMPKPDWDGSWAVPAVDDTAWAALVERMRVAADKTMTAIRNTTEWTEDSAGAAVVMAVHTAYHLGQIRQSLCTLDGCPETPTS